MLAGTVPSSEEYLDGTVPSSKSYLDGTVPSSKKLVDGTYKQGRDGGGTGPGWEGAGGGFC